MAINEWDGHLTSEDMGAQRAWDTFYILGNARICTQVDNPWNNALRAIGAVQVDRETYIAADSTRREGQ